MVRAIKSICKFSLPLRVYGPMRSTHKHFQGFVMTVFGGRCPYLRDHLLIIWQDLQDFVSDWIMVCIPFQYIAAFIVSSRFVCPGCCRWWSYHLTARNWSCLGITSHPSLHTQVVFNELDLQSLINYCIALKGVLQGGVSFLGFCNFHCC